MIGTMPIFYKIPVTCELASAVRQGISPSHTTTVEMFVPPVQNEGKMYEEGIIPLENRRTVLQCFEAFKQCLVCAALYSAI
jgi:hypothetical protein